MVASSLFLVYFFECPALLLSRCSRPDRSSGYWATIGPDREQAAGRFLRTFTTAGCVAALANSSMYPLDSIRTFFASQRPATLHLTTDVATAAPSSSLSGVPSVLSALQRTRRVSALFSGLCPSAIYVYVSSLLRSVCCTVHCRVNYMTTYTICVLGVSLAVLQVFLGGLEIRRV